MRPSEQLHEAASEPMFTLRKMKGSTSYKSANAPTDAIGIPWSGGSVVYEVLDRDGKVVGTAYSERAYRGKAEWAAYFGRHYRKITPPFTHTKKKLQAFLANPPDVHLKQIRRAIGE